MDRMTSLRLAPLLAGALLLAACSTASLEQSNGPAEITINPSADADPAALVDDGEAEPTAAVVSTSVDQDLRQRCIDGIAVLDRRWEEEGFEYPDEGPELSEEELEQTMAPPQPFVDGVAGPDDRPALAAMEAFDPETMPIPQLDRFRESCFEQGLVTEAEIYGDDEDDEGAEDEDDWCEELASLPLDETREFAAEDGEDVVREEFEACGLPSPLDS